MKNPGRTSAIRNGLNPEIYAHEEFGTWISILLSVAAITYATLTRANRILTSCYSVS